MKKYTVQDILNFRPCDEYTQERIEKLFKLVGCKKYVTLPKIFKADIPVQDLFWLVLRPEFIPEKQLHEIGIWCFERIAQPIWEKYYPNDNRPQEAIRIKKLWLKNKATDEELAAARAAAGEAAGAAAWAAARAAAGAAAREAAWAAAREAARAAAWEAAGAAAWEAAWEAAGEAARAAARAAAGEAAWAAAWAAAREAAWAATWEAAGEAAWEAAGEAAGEAIKKYILKKYIKEK
jgi:hypothetical protein